MKKKILLAFAAMGLGLSLNTSANDAKVSCATICQSVHYFCYQINDEHLCKVTMRECLTVVNY